ncbi:MAG: hypothetical protein IR159_05365 [Brevundimonas sp.]|nr:hypothetical protein [Brevundimonas sp.]
MANAAEMTDQRRGGRRVLGPVAAPRRGPSRSGPALTRSQVLRESLGGRTWIGALTNLADHACLGVTVRIRFLDGDRRPVGAPLSGRAGWLGPGAGLHLQARLPAGASGLEIVSLRWTAGARTVDLQPDGLWPLAAAPA